MKINKIILAGILLILFSALMFISDIFTPFIRPITNIFLMGSSKGKDILFFALFGLFLILSQVINIKDCEFTNKCLKIAIYLFTLLLAITLVLEIYLRLTLGIGIFTIFVSIKPDFATTSLLHTHLLKSILGKGITLILGSLIGSGINTASTLYSYVEPFAAILIILITITTIFLVLSLSKRPYPTTIVLCFAAAITLIGCLDVGLFGVPVMAGFVLLIAVYRNGYYMNYLVAKYTNNNKLMDFAKKHQPGYKLNKSLSNIRFILNRGLPYFVGLFIVILRLSLCFVGANTEYYEIDVMNPDNNITLAEYPVEKIDPLNNETIYYINNEENEHDLTMNLSSTLNNSCDYYTVSWNVYSYF